MNIVYGIDTSKQVNIKDIRDAIVECFTQAHGEPLSDLKNYSNNLSQIEFEEVKRINVRQMVRNFFEETGGDYDNPTKDSILKVLEEIKEFSVNFRDKETIDKHFKEILALLEKI